MRDRSLHKVTIPEMQGKICLGCMYNGGWLLMLDEATHDCFLFSITNRPTKIPLPPLPLTSEYKGTCGVLSSPANFTVVVASNPESERNVLLYCRPGDEIWTDLLVKNDVVIEIDGGIVAYAGKLYASAFNSNDLVVIDAIDGEVEMELTRTEEEEASHSSYVSYLVASCGDIFTVWIDFFGFPYDGAVTRIIVYRLNYFLDQVWRRVESIGSDRVFLVSGDYALSCSAAAAQLQGNCIYLVWSSCDCERLYKYCLDDMTISFHQILPEPTTPTCRAYWVVPNYCSIQGAEFKEQASLSPLMSNEDFQSSPGEQQGNYLPTCQNLPLELLELVASNLCLVSRLRFPSVCKSWSMISNPIGQAKVWPWLMHIPKQDGTCNMFDPLNGAGYTLHVEALKTDDGQHILRSSKDGWVVASAGLKSDNIVIINPFTKEIVKLPTFDRPYHFHGLTFSSSPTSPDCVVFAVCSSQRGDYVTVETWRPGEDKWRKLDFDHEEEESFFPIANNNPIYFRGEFYFLGRKGNFVVFNPSEDTWVVLNKPEPIYVELQVFDDDHEGAKFCYLVELEGELISVFMCNADEPPQVFQLDETNMAWKEVEDIGGAALFVDYRASFGMVSPGAGNGNKIFFPRYSEDGKHAAFYDMETKVYHPTFYGVKEPLNSVWVVPNLQCS
ncbi:unnamed protein product [Urochloa decumbens]|uniref:F-box domain-containing protein n=1 Tax=Urochloa decumbens TaxID=240449 RepID=A0ABC9BIV0_9POAL